MSTEPVVIDLETSGRSPWDSELLVVGVGKRALRADEGRAAAKMVLAGDHTVVCHTNYDLRWLGLEGAKLGPRVKFHDTKVMAWLLDATQELGLDDLMWKYCKRAIKKPITKRFGVILFNGVPIVEAPWWEVADYNEHDLKDTLELYNVLKQKLQEHRLWDHFVEEEAPFSKLLVEMEVAGMPFDRPAAEAMRERAAAQRDLLAEELVRETGIEDFKLSSTDLLREYLYKRTFQRDVKFAIPRMPGMSAERKLSAIQGIAPADVEVTKVGREYAYGSATLQGLGLKAPKQKTAGGKSSTSAKVLTVLYGDHPWVAKFLEWKALANLCSTFLDSWIEKEHNGRIHGRLDQASTVTGRLSAKEPNMQQVPTRSDWSVRALFAGDLFIGDYAGLEVRLSAHFSRDPLMMDVFLNGKDLYGVLAAEAWGGPADKSNEGRGLMKILVLSSQYGAQGAKLSEILTFAGMRYSEREADKFLGDLERTLPRLFAWRQEVIEEARVLGYVTTIGGRIRKLPNMRSAVWKLMATAERQAVNSKVQGSAADVVRRAMLKSREVVDPSEAQLLLQVHDEIIWGRGPGWNSDARMRLMEACETGHGFTLDVPLAFEATEAQSWADKAGSAGQVRAGEYIELAGGV